MRFRRYITTTLIFIVIQMNATTSEKQNPENLGINLDGRLDVREKKDFKQYIRENKDQLYPV